MKMGTVNWHHSDGPMKIFLTCATAHSRTRNQQNYFRMFAAQPAEKKCKGSQSLETDACQPAVTVQLSQVLAMHSMPIHVLQCVFHIEKPFCTHRFFHKYEQTCTEKFVHALLLILMREDTMLSKYIR